MLKKKRKKVVKCRGSHTHGCGSKKKRRGAGNRGGRGLAGTGKRGDQKKSYILRHVGNKYYGSHGFTPVRRREEVIINIGYINSHYDQLAKEGILEKEGDFYVLNLNKAGYDRLLGKGDLNIKLKVINGLVSRKAVDKIKAAKGVVE